MAPDGITAVPNGQGVAVQGSATNVQIGGNTATARNILSGNRNYGLLVNGTMTPASSIAIQGNYIGLDKNGNTITGSTQSFGVYLQNPNGVLIGGGSTGQGNVVSGNTTYGIYMSGTNFGQNVQIYGNTVGLKPDNETAAPNGTGISTGAMSSAAGSVLIGGSSAGQGNIISGNTNAGISLANAQFGSFPMMIKGNTIGLSASGVVRPNNGGISASGTSSNVIVGGIGTGEGNKIASNKGNGVNLTSASNSNFAIRGNSIVNNVSLGIDLGNNGPTNNDLPTALDADTGANGLQNFPRRTTLTSCDSTTQQATALWSMVNTTYNVDFYANPSGRDPTGYGQGEQYVSSTTITTDGNGYASITPPAGVVNMSMTATDPNGNTSEFSNERAVTISGCGVTNKTTNDNTPPLSGTVSLSGFTAGIAPTSATISVAGQSVPATISGSTWTVPDNTLTSIADGTYDVTMTIADPESKMTTSYTKAGALSIDSTQPTASMTRKSGQSAYTNTSSAWFTLTLSEAAATGTLTASDINLGTTTGTVTIFTQIDATHYEFEVTGMTSGNTVTPSIAANGFTDSNGNGNTASTGDANNWVMYDTTAPQAFAINVDITSSGHNLDNPLISWSTTDGQSGIDHYTMSVDGGVFTTVSSPQSLILTPASSHTIVVRAYDKAGNVREKTVVYPPIENITAPTTLANHAITDTSIQIVGLTGMIITNVTISGAGSSGFTCTPIPSATTTVPITCTGGQITQSGTLTVSATTDAGVTTQNTQDYVIDTVAPTVTVNQAAGQADPTNQNSATFRVAFSEPINESSFTASDIVLSGTTGTVTSFTKIDSRTWDVTVIGMTNGDTVAATLPAGKVTDLANNANTASTSTDNQVTYDTTRPTVTVNQAAGQADPTNVDSASFTIVFSKLVSGFTASSIKLSGTTGVVTNLMTADNKTFTATVTGMTSGDTVKADVTANVATDAAGNQNVASTSTDNQVTFDNTPPKVTINLLTTNSKSPALSGTIDDPTATIQITVDGHTYAAQNNGNGTWSLAANTISPALTDGIYDVSVVVTDTAGNVGNDSSTDELMIDTVAPTGTVDQVDPTINNSPALSGTVDDLTATITVTIDGHTFTASHNGDGTWALPASVIVPALTTGTYTATVTFTDAAGNRSEQMTSITILRGDADTPTVDTTTWIGGQLKISGTYDSANSQSLRVKVNGVWYKLGTDSQLTASGDNWTLDLTSLPPALATGKYDVIVEITTRNGATITDTSLDELAIIAPALTPSTVAKSLLAPNTGVTVMNFAIYPRMVLLALLAVSAAVTMLIFQAKLSNRRHNI